MKKKILVACRIFEDEIKAVLPTDIVTEILWLDAGLHADLACLKSELTKALSTTVGCDADVRILFGGSCHPEINILAGQYGAKTLSGKNCIEVFLGDKSQYLEDGGTMVMTPGWVRAWPQIMQSLGWDEVDVRINLGRYKRILIVDSGVNPLSDEEILAFFDLTQVPLEIEPLDLCHFKSEVAGLLSIDK
jgi:Protein of unknown function (DUF1638)